MVITSVDRDDLDDGGAEHFAQTIRAIRHRAPGTTIEILTPDFLKCAPEVLEAVVAARPDVFNHNLETVPGLYPEVRPGRALFPFAAAVAAGQGDSTRRCSPSPASWWASARTGRRSFR